MRTHVLAAAVSLLLAPVAQGGPLLIKQSLSGSHWLLGVAKEPRDQIALQGLGPVSEYYLIPKAVRLKRDVSVDGTAIDLRLPAPGALVAADGTFDWDDLPAGASVLNPSALASLMEWEMNPALRVALSRIAHADPESEITFSDYSRYPAVYGTRVVKIARFRAETLLEESKRALAIDRPMMIRIRKNGDPFSDNEVAAFSSGFSLRINGLGTLRKSEVAVHLLSWAGLLSGVSGSMRFYQAYDLLDSRWLPGLERALAQDSEFGGLKALPESSWRLPLLSAAFDAYFEPADNAADSARPACRPAYRVQLRRSATGLDPVYRQAYYSIVSGSEVILGRASP